MKRFVIGGLAAVAFAGTAVAADIPVQAPVYKAPVVHAFSWTGCYVGGHVGGIRNDSELSAYPSGSYAAATVAAGTYSYDVDGTSFTGGGQYGCNYQTGSLVFGLDSSFSWAGIDETVNATHAAVPALVAYSETTTQQVDWYSTSRARLGWAHDRWMIFVAGGLATGRVESTYNSPLAGGVAYSASQSKTRYGWTLGAGLEYALSENWFVRGEYLYVDLGKYSYTSLPSAGAPTLTWDTAVDTRFHVARIALSYRFTRAPSLLHWAMGGFQY